MNKNTGQDLPTVVIATGVMNAGGTETLIMEMLRHRTGWVRYVMMIHYQGVIPVGIYDEEIRRMGVEMVYIPSVGALGVNGYCRKFKEVVAEIGRVDIVHSHLNANGGIICMAAKKAGICHRISHCHADIRFKGSRFQNLKSELSLQVLRLYVNHYSNHFWACSHAAWKRLFYAWKREVVIPNMINVEAYLSSPSEKEVAKAAVGMENKFVVGAVGRVARIKNYELAIRVVALLKEQGRDVHFVCYGRFDPERDIYCAKLVRLAEALKVSDRTHFKGNTTEVPRYIKAFDVFLMPSITEGFGMAAIEAQAAGIPVLLSDGVPQIVDVGVGLATFLPVNNVQAWAEAIVRARESARPENNVIVEAFDHMGYNSVTMVKKIEEKYIEICQ